MSDDDILSEDLYGLLGVEETAELKDIQKAWRKKSLTCHPDKFPDDAEKALLFVKITKALDILSDEAKRAAYDQKHKAKALRVEKKRKMDDASRKMRDDLEERERKFKKQRTEEDLEKIQLQQEIERMREAGLRKIKEQEMRRAEKVAELQKKKEEEEQNAALKIRWSSSNNYSEENLRKIFGAFGEIHVLLIGKKGGSAVLQYYKTNDALNCFSAMMNHPLYDFKVEWVRGQPPVVKQEQSKPTTATSVSSNSLLAKGHKGDDFMKAHASFEEMILAQMRKASAKQ